MAENKVEFPYSDFDAGLADDFVKIGGRAEAFRYMAKGFKEIRWRRRTERSRVIRELAADAELRKSVFETVKSNKAAAAEAKPSPKDGRPPNEK